MNFRLSTFTLFVVGFCSYELAAQQECGFDPMHQLSHAHSLEIEAEESTNQLILNQLDQLTEEQRNGEHLIPVVVHVIHTNGPENISDDQIATAIEQLNEAFSNEGDFNHPEGVNVPIRFCLAGTDPDGEFTTGIVRVEDELTEMLVPSQDLALKNLSRWDPERYLNIWLVASITREENNAGVVGYATFPDAHGSDLDGVVCEAEFFGITNGYSKVHIHEVGHYLGLYHTFQNGCPNDDCQTSGDWVCDTPPDQHVFTTFCFDGTNSCSTDEDDSSENNPFRAIELGGLGDQDDEQINFMDYSNLACFTKFTAGQSDRMLAALSSVRASLLEGDRCVSPCDNPFTATLLIESESIEVGGSSVLTVVGTGFNTVQWSVDGVEAASGNVFSFNGDEEGNYEILVTVSGDDPGCTQEFMTTITVICDLDPQFDLNQSQWTPGSTIELSNGDPNASSWSWTVNGEEVSTSSSFSYVFEESGVFTIALSISNGLCSKSFSQNVSIGNCLSGNEANYWAFNVTNGDAFGLNFNSGSAELVTENPDLPAPVNHNKGAFSDESGNLRYLSTGVAVTDASGQTLLNGGGLLSHPSAHYGTIFIRKPGSDHEVYLFTCDADENNYTNGLRYNLIDDDLNGGLGAIVDGFKNTYIDYVGMESAVTLSHCNLVDFWLVYYNANEGVMKAQLFTENGLSGDPVISDIPDLQDLESFRMFPFVANGAGDRLHRLNTTYSFDASTGEVTVIHETGDPNALRSAWSPSGRYIYFWAGELDIDLYRIDTDLPVDEWTSSIELVYDGQISDYGIGMALGPDGVIYSESVISGFIGAIPEPDAENPETPYISEYFFTGNVINGFQNNHHSYVYGPSLYLEGSVEACTGDDKDYQVFRPDCITAPVSWELFGQASLNETGNGQVSVEFHEDGEVLLIASMDLSCGTLVDSLLISVNPSPSVDLGPDLNICTGNTLELDAGGPFDSYAWSNGETSQQIVVAAPGSYGVTVSNGSCSASDEVVVQNTITPVIDLGPDIEICNEVVVLSAGDDFLDYTWQDGFVGPTYTVYEAGTYTVTASIPCSASDTVVVTDCGEIINLVGESASAEQDIIWPNPANSGFHVKPGTAPESISIYNALGSLVERMELNASEYYYFSTQNWAAGIYSVVISDNKETRSLSVLVNH